MKGSHRDKDVLLRLVFKGQAYFSKVFRNARRGSYAQDSDSLGSGVTSTPSGCTERMVLATKDAMHMND